MLIEGHRPFFARFYRAAQNQIPHDFLLAYFWTLRNRTVKSQIRLGALRCQRQFSLYFPNAMAIVPSTTATVPMMAWPVTCSLPRRNISEIVKLNNGVVATIGDTITTRAFARATRVSNAPMASQKPDVKKCMTPRRFQTSPWSERCHRT